MLAPSSAHPRAASMPIPCELEAPVTTTTLPLRLNRSIMPQAIIRKVEKDETPEQFAATISGRLGQDVEIAIALKCTGV